jgi:hypothetical protein
MDTRSIEKDKLTPFQISDTEDPASRGLRLPGNDGNLVAQNPVKQG